jgi:hypothetical protein
MDDNKKLGLCEVKGSDWRKNVVTMGNLIKWLVY